MVPKFTNPNFCHIKMHSDTSEGYKAETVNHGYSNSSLAWFRKLITFL